MRESKYRARARGTTRLAADGTRGRDALYPPRSSSVWLAWHTNTLHDCGH
eukprot:COSAG02_NODE_56343_length_286_cov_0.566845_1_plen_49_part_10